MIFIFVKDDNYSDKDGLKDLMPDMILVSDWNKSRELLPIKKYPYSLIFDKNHNLVGKVEGYQDCSTATGLSTCGDFSIIRVKIRFFHIKLKISKDISRSFDRDGLKGFKTHFIIYLISGCKVRAVCRIDSQILPVCL